MLAIQAPSGVAAITPARLDRPFPAEIARSTSGPRPNTSWLPSASRMTWPDAVLTCAATDPGYAPAARATIPGSGDGGLLHGRDSFPVSRRRAPPWAPARTGRGQHRRGGDRD